jgi:hypothetical protein
VAVSAAAAARPAARRRGAAVGHRPLARLGVRTAAARREGRMLRVRDAMKCKFCYFAGLLKEGGWLGYWAISQTGLGNMHEYKKFFGPRLRPWPGWP